MVKKAKRAGASKASAETQKPAIPPRGEPAALPGEAGTAPEPAAPSVEAPPTPKAEPSPRPAPSRPVVHTSLNLEWIFSYHAPSEDQVDRYDRINEAAKGLARVILESCPACADRSAAIRKVREARMTANASIALHGAV